MSHADATRGMLIALEGIDGAGTTTQAKMLREYLEASGRAVLQTAEPSSRPIGKIIRRCLRGELNTDPATLALLYAADRLDHLREEVEPALAENKVVITDRYVFSSLAYQSIDLAMSWVGELNRYAKNPDLTIFLEIDAETALERIHRRGEAIEIFERADKQRLIASKYKDIFGSGTGKQGGPPPDPDGSMADPRRSSRDPGGSMADPGGSGESTALEARLHPQHRAHIIDGTLSQNAIHESITKRVEKFAREHQLWEASGG